MKNKLEQAIIIGNTTDYSGLIVMINHTYTRTYVHWHTYCICTGAEMHTGNTPNDCWKKWACAFLQSTSGLLRIDTIFLKITSPGQNPESLHATLSNEIRAKKKKKKRANMAKHKWVFFFFKNRLSKMPICCTLRWAVSLFSHGKQMARCPVSAPWSPLLRHWRRQIRTE